MALQPALLYRDSFLLEQQRETIEKAFSKSFASQWIFLQNVKRLVISTFPRVVHAYWRVETLLKYACQMNDADYFLSLLNFNAQLDHSNRPNEGEYPIHFAAMNGNRNMVQAMIERMPGLIMHALTFLQERVIHKAVLGGSLELVQFIVKSDPNCLLQRDYLQQTPLYLAAYHLKLDIVPYLTECNGNACDIPNAMGNLPPTKNSQNAIPGLLFLLTEDLSNVNYTNNFGSICHLRFIGCTLLNFTAEYMALLAQKQVHFKANKNVLGLTALHYAAKMGNEALVEALVAYDQNVNTVDLKGKTPLHSIAASTAMHVYREFYSSILPLLLEHGADPSIRNREGKTVADIAVERQQHWMLPYFEQ
ncbi:ankyrin repeat-containing domain protein [Cladochytrium replicatum]|nr:ankyrin repeat-containing domain protein [Cladochytrium replicatum]